MAGPQLSDVALLERLVAFDTVSCRSNLALLEFLAEYAGGARVERFASPDGTKANLLVRFGPEREDRAGLVLSGHMDVVPAEEEGWRGDPFRLRQEGERLCARGACDMKGFLAVATNVAREAGALEAPLVLLFTYDEEVGTVGARRFVESGPPAASLPRQAIIGEPTELRVVRMHKGHLRVRITLEGVSAHSGYPHLGRNAIEAAGRVLASLRGLRHRLEQAGGPNAEHFPEVPFVPLNVGVIRGGVAVNVVPDRCVLEVGVRPLPGMDGAALAAAVREAVANAAGDAPFGVEVLAESPPLLTGAGAPVHAALRELTGQEGDVAVSYATDAGWLARAGMDCVVFGPGSITVAHKPNEYVPRGDLERARGFLGRAVERFCR